jgi:cold shock protein
LATGRVLQFDQARGYGFVAADDGGEDVFLHASVFDGDIDQLVPGMKVEFKIMAGERGRKAFAVRVGEDDLEEEPVPLPRPAPPPSQAPPVPATHAAEEKQAPDDEQLCDVLSPTEFRQELTELLLSDVPGLTGQQILDVRHGVLECARKHGWVDI